MKKIIIAFMLVIMLCIAAMSTSHSAYADTEWKFTTEYAKSKSHLDMLILTDNETGVEYIVTIDSFTYGTGVGITPRYNSDGTLYINSEEE